MTMSGLPTPPSPNPPCLTCDDALPRPVPFGGSEFYQARYDDFVRRHPGATPPSYYLGYGKKYADRFMNQTYAKLTPAGQAWLLRARRNLQAAIEKERAKDPVAFDKLEQNDAAFKRFAYDTHPQAYLAAGLKALPITDLTEIGLTPDFKDLFSKDGVVQVWDVAKTARPVDVWNVGTATAGQGASFVASEATKAWNATTTAASQAESAVSSTASRAWTSVVDWWNN